MYLKTAALMIDVSSVPIYERNTAQFFAHHLTFAIWKGQVDDGFLTARAMYEIQREQREQ